MAKFGKSLGIFIVGNLILNMIYYGVSNLIDGKDVFGRRKKRSQQKETYMDWKGNIHMGTADYQIV